MNAIIGGLPGVSMTVAVVSYSVVDPGSCTGGVSATVGIDVALTPAMIASARSARPGEMASVAHVPAGVCHTSHVTPSRSNR